VDVEDPADPRQHLDCADALLELFENLRCQTDSVRQRPSGHAVFDANVRAIGHEGDAIRWIGEAIAAEARPRLRRLRAFNAANSAARPV
jgi:hypothetical protein